MSATENKNEEIVEMIVDGVALRTTLTKKYKKRRKWEYPDPRKIVSYIPGTIVELYFNEGDSVEEGEAILLFEAMKMQTKMYMPYTGKIVKILSQVGDRFPKEQVLLEIE